MFVHLAGFTIELLIMAGFLWVGMKFASVYAGMPKGGQYCSYLALIKVCFFTVLASTIPSIGWMLSWVVLFLLLQHETEAGVPELVIMVLVSRIAGVLAAMFIIPAILLNF